MTPEQHEAVCDALAKCTDFQPAKLAALHAALEPLKAVDLARVLVENVSVYGAPSAKLHAAVHARMEYMLAAEQAAAQDAAAAASAALTKSANRLAKAAAGLALLQVVIQILQWRYGS